MSCKIEGLPYISVLNSNEPAVPLLGPISLALHFWHLLGLYIVCTNREGFGKTLFFPCLTWTLAVCYTFFFSVSNLILSILLVLVWIFDFVSHWPGLCIIPQLVQKAEDSQTPSVGGQPTVAEQLLKKQEQQQQPASTVATEGLSKTTEGLAATSQPPTPVKATASATQQKYAVTPQVVQEGKFALRKQKSGLEIIKLYSCLAWYLSWQ